MINLLGANIKHKNKCLGIGKVVEHTDKYITLEFTQGTKRFVFPDAFEEFLQCEDDNLQYAILEILSQKREQEAELKRQKQEEQERLLDLQKKLKETGKSTKTYPRENIAFKCNFCNGGINKNGIGYVCACTDEMIKYNIEVAHHNWCCDVDSPCRQYYDNIITRKELDEISKDGGFVCYESQMLRNWTAFAGYSLTEENNHRPMKLNKVQLNSLAILTTREPNTTEADRFVFGVFLVDDAYEGDNRDEGYVTTSSKFKLSLALDEAKRVLFWNYYKNGNAPEKIAWGQGLHRYVSHQQAASILYDIVMIKKGTKDEELAEEFLEHFCETNRIKISELPIKDGPLMKVN